LEKKNEKSKRIYSTQNCDPGYCHSCCAVDLSFLKGGHLGNYT